MSQQKKEIVFEPENKWRWTSRDIYQALRIMEEEGMRYSDFLKQFAPVPRNAKEAAEHKAAIEEARNERLANNPDYDSVKEITEILTESKKLRATMTEEEYDLYFDNKMKSNLRKRADEKARNGG